LYLRKMVVGASRDHLAAQLCRKWKQYGSLSRRPGPSRALSVSSDPSHPSQ
jgi:hypothetical protein